MESHIGYSGAIKKNGTTISEWWLRSARNDGISWFLAANSKGETINEYATTSLGVSPAFRIG